MCPTFKVKKSNGPDSIENYANPDSFPISDDGYGKGIRLKGVNKNWTISRDIRDYVISLYDNCKIEGKILTLDKIYKNIGYVRNKIDPILKKLHEEGKIKIEDYEFG